MWSNLQWNHIQGCLDTLYEYDSRWGRRAAALPPVAKTARKQSDGGQKTTLTNSNIRKSTYTYINTEY